MIRGRLPWSRWPWTRCRARFRDELGTRRCDLDRRHRDAHVAEEGMHYLTWTDRVRVVSANHPAP